MFNLEAEFVVTPESCWMFFADFTCCAFGPVCLPGNDSQRGQLRQARESVGTSKAASAYNSSNACLIACSIFSIDCLLTAPRGGYTAFTFSMVVT
jgi:hypothetical protein